jgi:hypothetical protein
MLRKAKKDRREMVKKICRENLLEFKVAVLVPESNFIG